MPCTQPHQFTLMQNMQQMSPGHSKLMISFRKLENFKIENWYQNHSPLTYACDLFYSYIRYANTLNTYWTGYFTSRPALKGYIRMLSGYYLVCLM